MPAKALLERWIGLAGLLVGLGAAPVFGQQPAGAVYAVGRAYEARGDTARALRVWKAGLDSLDAVGQVDARLSDAYVRAVFRSRAEDAYGHAARVYLDLIEHAGAFADGAAQRLFERHVAQMLTLWPDAARPRLVEGGAASKGGLRLAPDAGATMAAWWRGQDLELATPRNERLEEHLLRVAQAERRYPYEEALAGYDDRGTLFVRLGEPDEHDVITYQEDARLGEILSQGARVSLSEMPENELWYYPSLDVSALYVFVRRAGRYQLATPADLIPRKLRATGPMRSSLQLVALMQFLNRRLGSLNPHYATRFAGGVNDVLIYQRLNRWYLDLSVLPPGTRLRDFLFSALHDVERDEADEIRDRDDRVPQHYSQLFDGLDVLPVAFGFARFLDDDGSTRTELFWSHPPDVVLTGGRLVQLTTVQKQEDYRTRSWVTSRYAPNAEELAGRPFVRTRTLHGDTARYHLHLQWELYDAAPGAALGPRRRVNVFKVDSLAALNPDPARLEMSDLMPSLDVDPGRLARPDGDGLAVKPYPLPNLTAGVSPALYFEVYHLHFGTDDLTRYTVEYEVERREKGGVWRLFQPRRERTAAAISYTGTSRTAREYVVVDLSDASRADRLKVRVRVTDETSGQQVERAIEFGFLQQ